MSASALFALLMGALGLVMGLVIGMIGAWRVQSAEIARRRIG